MAQQITNNTSLIDALTSTNNNFVDSSANQFDSILDIANKSFTQQNQDSKTSSLLSYSTKTNFSTKTSADSYTTLRESNYTQPMKQDNVTTPVSAEKNISVEKDVNKDSLGNMHVHQNETKSEHGFNNKSASEEIGVSVDVSDDKVVVETKKTQTSDEISNKVEEDVQVEVVETVDVVNPTDTAKSDLEETDVENIDTDISEQVLDIVSTLVVEEDAELNILPTDSEVEEIDTENTIENVDIDVNIESDSDAQINSTIEVDLNIDESLLNQIDNEAINDNAVDELDTNNIKIQTNINVIPDILNNVDNTVSADDVDAVMLSVNPKNNQDVDIDIQSAQNNKELISQKMVDELNVTLEEIAPDNVVDDTTSSTFMDSMEQIVKYEMEKNETESVVPVVQKDIKNVEETTNLVDMEEVLIEENIEIAEDTITNSEDLSIDVDSSEETVNIKDSSEDNQIKVSEETGDSFGDGENGAEQDVDKKTAIKKVQVSKDDVENFTDIDIDSTVNDSKLSFTSDVSTVAKSNVMGVGRVTASHESASQHIQTTNISKEDVIAQIHSKLQSLNNTTNTKLTMVLNPESLGKVSIQLTNSKNGLVAEMVVASQTVKDILDSNISNLKETLTAQGVQVNDVSVKVSQGENNAEMDYTEQENSNSNQQEQSKQQNGQEEDKNKFEELFFNSVNEEQENNIN